MLPFPTEHDAADDAPITAEVIDGEPYTELGEHGGKLNELPAGEPAVTLEPEGMPTDAAPALTVPDDGSVL